MGIQEQQLLRMLEPALRPGAAGLGGVGGKSAAGEPIETRGFDAILEEAQAMAAKLPDVESIDNALTHMQQQTEKQSSEQQRNTNAIFSELQHIENASVARIKGGDQVAMTQQKLAG